MTYWGGAGAGSVAAAGGEWRGTQRREQRPARPERETGTRDTQRAELPTVASGEVCRVVWDTRTQTSLTGECRERERELCCDPYNTPAAGGGEVRSKAEVEVSRGRTKGKCGEGAQKQPGAAFCISVDSRFDDNRAGTLAAIAERVYEPSLHSSCRALRRM